MHMQNAKVRAGILGLALGLCAPGLAMAQEGGLVAECDASGETLEMGELLNAEPRAGVVTILKTPTHPGKVGPYKVPALGLLGQGLLALGTVGMGLTATRRRRRRA